MAQELLIVNPKTSTTKIKITETEKKSKIKTSDE